MKSKSAKDFLHFLTEIDETISSAMLFKMAIPYKTTWEKTLSMSLKGVYKPAKLEAPFFEKTTPFQPKR